MLALVKRIFLPIIVTISIFSFISGCLALFAPLLEELRQYDYSYYVYQFLGNYCHQLPTKCFFLEGRPTGLCARCLGIYLAMGIGFLIGYLGLIRWNYKVNLLLLFISIGATLLWKLYQWHSPKWFSFFLGSIGGLGVGCCLNLCYRWCRIKKEGDVISRKVSVIVIMLAIVVSLVCPQIASAGGTVDLPAGTVVILRTTESINSETASAGQAVVFEVAEDVKINGITVIKSGTQAMGEISEAQKTGSVGKEGKVLLTPDFTTTIDGQRVLLRGNMRRSGADKQTETVVVGAVLCPLMLMQKGDEASVPQGSQLKVYTSNSLKVKY